MTAQTPWLEAMRPRVGVVGGSVAGLAAARFLRSKGADVQVFERSAGELAERGAGIALDPAVLGPIGGVAGSSVTGRIVIGADGRELWRTPIHKYMTAWSVIYRRLRSAVPDDIVHAGRPVTAVRSDDDSAELVFTDGGTERFDYVVGADGLGSTARSFVCPGFAPEYCGYVAIRGMVEERSLPHDCAPLAAWADDPGFVNFFGPRTHVTAYWIPHDDRRVLNWMWYRNCASEDLDDFLTDSAGHHHRWSLPPGQMTAARRDQLVEEMGAVLPAPFAAAARATPALFDQAIYRGVAEPFVRQRVVLVGDAAHVAVPHIGAGVSLAIQDAIALADAFDAGIDRLAAWGAARHAATVADLDVAARLGHSLQHEDHDWTSWSDADFDRWWRSMVRGHHLYFED